MDRKTKDVSGGFPIFLSRADLQPFTGLSTKTCLRILTAHGIKPIDVGDKRRALKWHRDAVKLVLDAMHAEAQTSRQPRPKHSILGKSLDTLMAEMSA